MNIEYLHYFLDVAKTKSITRAAKLNFISPQGMSRAMSELEKELGCTLLVRYPNKLELSPTGEELIPQAENVMESYSRLLEFATEKSFQLYETDDSIQLECQNVAMLAFLTQDAKDYILGSRKIHFKESVNPQLRQVLLSGDTSNGNATVGLLCFFNQERTADIGTISELEERGFLYHPYLKTYDKAIVAEGSPLAEKSVLSNDDILSRPLVCTSSHLYNVLAKRFGRDAIELSSPDFSLRKHMVERDLAVSFLPAIAELTMPDKNGFVMRNIEHPYEVEIGFIGTQEGLGSKHFEKLREILDTFYRANEDSGLYTLL